MKYELNGDDKSMGLAMSPETAEDRIILAILAKMTVISPAGQGTICNTPDGTYINHVAVRFSKPE